MGNFEKLSVLVIVVIIVMILVVALYTWTDNPDSSGVKEASTPAASVKDPRTTVIIPAPQQPTLPAAMSATADDKSLPGSAIAPSAFPPAAQGAAATLPPPEPVKAEPKVHEVVSGDTLGKIAKKYGTTVAAIEQANPGVEPTSLRVGAKLAVPEKAAMAKADPKADPKADAAAGKDSAATSAKVVEVASVKPGTIYTFKKGDTLPGLSKRAYGTADRWHEIWIANYSAIDNPDVVPPGTRVKLPAK